jgi:hypothetical protein
MVKSYLWPSLCAGVSSLMMIKSACAAATSSELLARDPADQYSYIKSIVYDKTSADLVKLENNREKLTFYI